MKGDRAVKKDLAQKSVSTDAEPPVELKDPALAALLGWLVPGGGHLYQGRTAKAVLFFACIMGTFLYGLYLGGNSELGWGRVVYASWRDGDKRLPYLCQVGIGLPALPAMVQALRVRRGEAPRWGGFMAPPRLESDPFDRFDQPTLNQLNLKLAGYFDLGTTYTMIAGLLNILAIYDASCGPVFLEKGKKEDDDQPEDEDQPDATPDAAS